MNERGTIRNLSYTMQRADFSGLRFGNITPTDIDGLIEFENRVCVFMEAKHGSADLPLGQRLALERNCDKWGENGIVLVVRNVEIGSSLTYKIGELPVIEYRHNRKWAIADGTSSCIRWIERFATKRLGREIKANAPSAPVDKDWVDDYDKEFRGHSTPR